MAYVIRQPLIAVSPDGSRREVIIQVGVPVEDRGVFRCKVHLLGVDCLPAGIVGEDAMQSLYLGLRFISMRLAAQEEDRGIRYYHPEDMSEPFSWRQTWYGQPVETAG